MFSKENKIKRPQDARHLAVVKQVEIGSGKRFWQASVEYDDDGNLYHPCNGPAALGRQTLCGIGCARGDAFDDLMDRLMEMHDGT